MHSRTSLVTEHNTKADRFPLFPWASHYSNILPLLLLFLHHTHAHTPPLQPPRALSLPKSTSARRDVGPCQSECLDRYLNSWWLFEEFPGDGSLCWHHQGEQVVYPRDVSHLKVSWTFCPRLGFSAMHMPAGYLYPTFQLRSTVFFLWQLWGNLTKIRWMNAPCCWSSDVNPETFVWTHTCIVAVIWWQS